ncbi:MAG: hypothetical protein ABIR06_11295 [Cyclobacteriaceae bacterium]
MHQVLTCRESGHRSSDLCGKVDTVLITKRGLQSTICSNHKTIHLSTDLKYQLHSACSDLNSMAHVNWFVLPPVQEYYYKAKNISYKTLPPFHRDCENPSSLQAMDLVYPKRNARLFIPRGFDGKPGSSIFELAHRNENVAEFWHLDGVYIGSTKRVHKLLINPPEGAHVLTLIDASGQSLKEHFTVISTMERSKCFKIQDSFLYSGYIFQT